MSATPASPASALARSVLPVPGGPVSMTPLGSCAPSRTNRSGVWRKSTISLTSSLASPMPATCSKVTPVLGVTCTSALDRLLKLRLCCNTHRNVPVRKKGKANSMAMSAMTSVVVNSSSCACTLILMLRFRSFSMKSGVVPVPGKLTTSSSTPSSSLISVTAVFPESNKSTWLTDPSSTSSNNSRYVPSTSSGSVITIAAGVAADGVDSAMATDGAATAMNTARAYEITRYSLGSASSSPLLLPPPAARSPVTRRRPMAPRAATPEAAAQSSAPLARAQASARPSVRSGTRAGSVFGVALGRSCCCGGGAAASVRPRRGAARQHGRTEGVGGRVGGMAASMNRVLISAHSFPCTLCR
mmetsp:Transcript_99510/g.276935  ORF Transcript_99510/g.276935 Transcript_99510/m.276935 type:complete len:357 (-) Transcript_99510:109-1179(-)